MHKKTVRLQRYEYMLYIIYSIWKFLKYTTKKMESICLWKRII